MTLSRMTLGKCRLLQRHFRDVTLIPTRVTDMTLSRMTLGKCRLLQRHFRDIILTPTRITDITLSRMTLYKCRLLKIRFRDVILRTARITYITLWGVSWAGRHFVLRILHSFLKKKVNKVEKGQTFSNHTDPTVSSRRMGRCVLSLVQIGSEMWICIMYIQIKKQTNFHLFI
jgi:uncharacterized protein YjbI with pentapeptide repeats